MKTRIESLIPTTEQELAFALILLVVAAAVFQSYQLGVFGHVALGVRETVKKSVKWTVKRLTEELREMREARRAKSASLYSATRH